MGRPHFAHNSLDLRSRLRSTVLIFPGLLACTAPPPPSGPSVGATEPRDTPTAERAAPSPPSPPSPCPERAPPTQPLPDVAPEHRTAAYWIERHATLGDLDAPLLDVRDTRAHNAALRHSGALGGLDVARGAAEATEQPDSARRVVSPQALADEVDRRLRWLRERVSAGEYVDDTGRRLDAGFLDALTADALRDRLTPTLHLATGEVPLRCGPSAQPMYSPSLDLRLDRNLCSTARAQEPVLVLAIWPNGMRLARTAYAMGWISADAALTPPVHEPALREAILDGPRVLLRRSLAAESGAAPGGALVPRWPEALAGSDAPEIRDGAARHGLLGTPRGLVRVPLPDDAAAAIPRPLTRRAFLQEAFSYLDTPYGWGGANGGRDCSRFVMDLLARFGVSLPRHTADQSTAGTFHVDVPDTLPERDRLHLFDAALREGVTLLHFPGHIMVYLGRDAAGRPMAIHSFAEFLVPCATRDPSAPQRAETLREVDTVQVSDLELGRGTSRRAFVERVTRVTVLGGAPGAALQAVATPRPTAPTRPPKRCRDGGGAAIYQSPDPATTDRPLRLIATTTVDPGPVELALFDPSGALHVPKPRLLGGPPFSRVATIERPAAGVWTAVLGDGPRVLACYKVRVQTPRATRAKASAGEEASDDPGAVWPIRRRWTQDPENFYAAFVESLFDYPIDEDLTWPNLHTLLQNAERNLLYDHFGRDEERALRMDPDCADLPYMLRAYFAWKLGLPYAHRRCNRGRAGRPPRCGDPESNLQPRAARDDVEAFQRFARREVRGAVHSASGRTHPDDDASDLYPVPLERAHLRPGIPFGDPYGHILIIARWVPQGFERYGTLIGADAQPDGTVGRRRFWRGNFLFTPDTTDVGAGFKAFRPVVYDRETREMSVPTNAELAGSDVLAPFSRQQYEGDADAFYDTMEGLINPRPLDPITHQLSLIDALEEAAVRRVVSIDNGERFMAARGGRPIDMPRGYKVFETTGPWEDFSTPARDMRLLVAMDTVVGLADAMRRRPERFGLRPGEALDAEVARVVERRDRELAARGFAYHDSTGADRRLTLAQLVGRRAQFEMAYNPNDCPELRWGASEADAAELQTCRRRAPAAQRKLMERYRSWFADRRRPPR